MKLKLRGEVLRGKGGRKSAGCGVRVIKLVSLLPQWKK